MFLLQQRHMRLNNMRVQQLKTVINHSPCTDCSQSVCKLINTKTISIAYKTKIFLNISVPYPKYCVLLSLYVYIFRFLFRVNYVTTWLSHAHRTHDWSHNNIDDLVLCICEGHRHFQSTDFPLKILWGNQAWTLCSSHGAESITKYWSLINYLCVNW